MRPTLFILCLVISTSYGLFGPIGPIIDQAGNSGQSLVNQLGQQLENSWNNIANQMEQLLGNFLNSINELQTTAQSLWEQVFGPAFDAIMKGAKSVLNEQLNVVSQIINNPENAAQNSLVEKYIELIKRFQTNVFSLYKNLFSLQHEGLLALQQDGPALEDFIRKLNDKIMSIRGQIYEWAEEIKKELETFAATLEGDWATIVNQYNQNIDLSVKKLLEMFQKLVDNLMEKFLKVAATVAPDAASTIEKLREQGLLSFAP